MKQCPGTYFAAVVEDVEKSEVVGTATLFVQRQFVTIASIVSCVCLLLRL